MLKKPIFSFLTTIILASFHPYTLLAASYSWLGPSGNWGTLSSWMPAGIPGAGDTVTINQNQVTVDASHLTNQLFVATGSHSSGRLELTDGAALRVTELAVIGSQNSSAEVVQTGGSFIIKPFTIDDPLPHPAGPTAPKYGLIIGQNLDNSVPNASATYTISGGLLQSYYDVTVGNFAAPGPTIYETLSALEIRGGKVEILDGKDLVMGFSGDQPTTALVHSVNFGRSEVNIYGGSLYVEGNVVGYGWHNVFTIHGSQATEVSIGGIGPAFGGLPWDDQVTIQLKLDKNGVTPLTVNGTLDTSMRSPSSYVTVIQPGFLALQNPEFVVVTAEEILPNVWSAFNSNMGLRGNFYLSFEGGKSVITFEASDSMPWDLDTGPDTFPTWGIKDGDVKGSVKVQGTEAKAMEVKLKKLGENADMDALAPLLVEYLNNTTVDTGVTFKLLTESSLLLTGSYLNGNGEAWFGWNLEDFGDCSCCSLGFESFRILGEHELRDIDGGVPEPATWGLLLLGCGGLLALRRRR